MTLELETRNDPNSTDDNLDDATRAVNELRAASEEHRARLDERLATETRALNERIATLETRLSLPTRNRATPTRRRLSVAPSSNIFATATAPRRMSFVR